MICKEYILIFVKQLKMNTQNKYTKLALSLLFDAIGLLSYAIPGLGELSDMFWAPASA